jgi:23S rRNA (adenine2503-C2)-methyltransferase
MRSLLATDESQLLEWLAERGEGAYRLRQIEKWIYQKRATSFDLMSDLPQALRDELAAAFIILSSKIAHHHQADDGTEKLLLQLTDGKRIECVLLRDGIRRTICVSSQVGCAMGCVFCASGLDGVDRNLTAGEIIEQALHLQALLPGDERLSHAVMMGMGEPLANVENVLDSLERICSPQGLGISARRITISTVGIPAAMDRLTTTNPRYHLAVSLHAASDALRNELVPVNKRIGIDKILAAADRYFEVSGRRLTFEYVLLAGINDSEEDARALAGRLRGRAALLNVIPYNPVAGLPYKTPAPAVVGRFKAILEEAGLTVRFRQRKGDKINAACGQLRRQLGRRDGGGVVLEGR